MFTVQNPPCEDSDQNLHWVYISEGTFSDVVAYFIIKFKANEVFPVLIQGHLMYQMQRRMDEIFDDVILVELGESDFLTSRRKG